MSSNNQLIINLFEEQIKVLQKHVQLLKDGATDSVVAVAETTKSVQKASADKPKKKRAPSAYQIFMQEHLKTSHQNHSEGETPKDIMTKISKIWNTLSEDAKKPYQDRAVTAKNQFVATSASEQKPKESKKRKAEVVASAPVVAPAAAAPVAPAIPATPAPVAPPTPATELEKTEKKKKKKHHHKDDKKSKE